MSIHAREGVVDRTLRTALASVVAAAALSWGAVARAENHQDPLSRAFFEKCAAEAGNVLDRRIPNGRRDVTVHPRVENGDAATCAALTWVKVRGKIPVMTMEWKGRTALSAWDCQHSALSWGAYRKSGASWVFVSGGYHFGDTETDGAACQYNGSRFASASEWGANLFDTGQGSTDTEYRIAFQAWSHDDQSLGHHDYCADPINCTWPVRLRFFVNSGTWPVRLQDWVVWTPSNGNWASWDTTTGAKISAQWGAPTDALVHGDWDGDSDSDFAVARTSANVITWFVINSSTGQWWQSDWGAGSAAGGGADTILRAADFDGDGRSDLSIWRPPTQEWWSVLSGPQIANRQVQTDSDKGDHPVVSDFDNDMRTDAVLYRAGNGRWRRTSSFDHTTTNTYWGTNVDMPLNADFDGDYKSDVAVFRVTDDTFYWIGSTDGVGRARQWGTLSDIPVSPSYIDADTISDFVIYRQSENRFYYITSTTGAGYFTAWGSTHSDVPVPDFKRGNN